MPAKLAAPQINIQGLSYKQLTALEQQIASAKIATRDAEQSKLIQRLSKQIANEGFDPKTLLAVSAVNAPTKNGHGHGKGAKTAKAKPIPVKYRRGQDTWTGRGRAPRWLVAAEKQGARREQFLVA